MKDFFKKAIEKAEYGLDIPVDFVTGNPRLQIIGNNNLLIENHKGILEYGEDILKVNCGNLLIKITGQNLELKTLGAEDLSVKGNIISIEYYK